MIRPTSTSEYYACVECDGKGCNVELTGRTKRSYEDAQRESLELLKHERWRTAVIPSDRIHAPFAGSGDSRITLHFCTRCAQ